jgi:hypothetical protein
MFWRKRNNLITILYFRLMFNIVVLLTIINTRHKHLSLHHKVTYIGSLLSRPQHASPASCHNQEALFQAHVATNVYIHYFK